MARLCERGCGSEDDEDDTELDSALGDGERASDRPSCWRGLVDTFPSYITSRARLGGCRFDVGTIFCVWVTVLVDAVRARDDTVRRQIQGEMLGTFVKHHTFPNRRSRGFMACTWAVPRTLR